MIQHWKYVPRQICGKADNPLAKRCSQRYSNHCKLPTWHLRMATMRTEYIATYFQARNRASILQKYLNLFENVNCIFPAMIVRRFGRSGAELFARSTAIAAWTLTDNYRFCRVSSCFALIGFAGVASVALAEPEETPGRTRGAGKVS